MRREKHIEDETYENLYKRRISDVIEKSRETEVKPENTEARRKNSSVQDPVDPFIGNVYNFSQDSLSESEDLTEKIKAAFKYLNDTERKIMTIIMQEASTKEIIKEMQISEEAFDRAIRSARNKLKRYVFDIVEPDLNQKIEMPHKKFNKVHFTLTSLSTVEPGSTFRIELFAHLERQRDEVLKRSKIIFNEKPIQVDFKGPVSIVKGSLLNVRIDLAPFIIDDPEDAIFWDGDIGNATFIVKAPKSMSFGNYKGRISIYLNGIPISKLYFVIHVGELSLESKPLSHKEMRYRSVFPSYASEDREEVFSILTGMRKIIPDLEIFMDIIALRSGDKYKSKLFQLIDKSDIFYLFWSRAAKDSKWVKMEWAHALKEKGIDFIDPVPLEPPDIATTPPELASHLHFNNDILAFKALCHWRSNIGE
ncbi:TIR domain-containing protein [bacterium]|nr:TIR domain-containing protein [bacterium]